MIYLILSTAILVVGTFFITLKKVEDLLHAILLSLLSPILYLPLAKLFATISGLTVGFIISSQNTFKLEISDSTIFHVAGTLSILISIVGLFLMQKVMNHGKDEIPPGRIAKGNDS